VLGHVGRLAREKNLHYLARAVIPWLEADAGRRFLLVGDGPESPELRERFARAGLEDRVLMTGKLTGSNLCDAYAAMDAFAFASLTETQGMVIAEAMAAGLPVFALDGPGVRDVVADGVNGRLVDPDAGPAALAAALESGTEPANLAQWRDAALATARRFDRARCADAVMAAYDRLGGHRVRALQDWAWWDRLRGRIEAEWELLSAKAESATGSLWAGARRGRSGDVRPQGGDDGVDPPAE
jgi:glycosyltransferase involved in cell wall biosynthesis